MDCDRFLQQLPALYLDWGKPTVRPRSPQFNALLHQVPGMTSANILQLLNLAVSCLAADEVYCEIGCWQGATLIGALWHHPGRLGYAIDNFSQFDLEGKNQERLIAHLERFGMAEQVLFCHQSFAEFFADLGQIRQPPAIGVYFYDGAHDGRSQSLGLSLALPFLADSALIIVDDSNWDTVQQATADFLAQHPQCRLILDLPTPGNGHSSFWNGVQILRWKRSQPVFSLSL